jgi:hypothetical protein
MVRLQLGIICVMLVIPAGCKPKRDARCPSDQIDVSMQVALVDDYGSEGFLRSLDRDDLQASGLAFLQEPVSTGMQGKLVSYCIVVADDPASGRTGREILQSEIDKNKIPPSRALGYSKKPEAKGFLWRTYLLVDPPAILDKDIRSATIETDEQTGETVIHVSLSNKAQKAFAALTAENIDRRIAIIVNDEVLTTLLIWEKNEAGELKIPLERLGHDDEIRWQYACGLLR